MSYKDLYVKLLQRVEGFSAKPYKDFKQYSIGYGEYCGDLYDKDKKLLPPPNKVLTPQEGLASLAKKADGFDQQYVISHLHVPVTDNQHAALVSMAYNLPACALAVIYLMNNHGTNDQIHAKMKEYVHAGGVVNKDLVARREIEFKCFTTGTW